MSPSLGFLPIPTADEVREEYAALGPPDFVVPGGGHGAAAVCRPLLESGYRVVGAANPIDEGGHSARIRWDLYRHLGYWTIIPGDTMNLLGAGFAHPAVYAITNSRLPKDLDGTRAEVAFGQAVDRALQTCAESERPILARFRSFAVAVGECAQRELVETGIAPLAGASFQNVLHAALMVHVGAYREGLAAVDQDRYRVGSYLLERAMHVCEHGTVLPMSFDKVTLVTKHACGRTVVGGINRVLLARHPVSGDLHYDNLVPACLLASPGAESPADQARKLAAARVVDWYGAEVEHGPLSESFNDTWVFREVRPQRPHISPRLGEALRALKPGGALIIPPGNCHESTYTFFLLEGVFDEIRAARARGAKVILVCNPVNLLFSAGYSVLDYLLCIERALDHSTGGRDIRIEDVVDRVVVNDPTAAPESVQRMMRGEGIPDAVKRELLHRTPVGPVQVSSADLKLLEQKGIEVIVQDMLETRKVSIRGIETDSLCYERTKLLGALLSGSSSPLPEAVPLAEQPTSLV